MIYSQVEVVGLSGSVDDKVSDCDEGSDSSDEDMEAADSLDVCPELGCSTVLYNDIGTIVKPCMSANEITASIKALTPGQNYKLLTEHFVPGSDLHFQRPSSMGVIGSFNQSGLKSTPG